MKSQERGFALIAVLAIMVIATSLAAAALLLARSTLATGQGYIAEIEGGHAADAAIRLAAIRLADSEGYGLADVARGPLLLNGWQVAVRIEDEAGKLDLNRGRRDAIEAALVDLGVQRSVAQTGLRTHSQRFQAIDDLAGILGLSTQWFARLQARFTIYGTDAPQAPGVRSPVETYRIIAHAKRGKRSVARWATVRLNPGFSQPFEWLDKGEAGPVV